MGWAGVILPGLTLQVMYIWPVIAQLKMDFCLLLF